MSTMNNLIQSLNDKYLQLEQLLKDWDEVMANKVEILTEYEGENGYEHGTLYTFDEWGLEKLQEIYDRFEKILEE